MDAASNTRRHVATDGARAEENDVRIEVLDDVLNSLDIRLRRVILQHGVVNDQHLARTILDQRLRLVCDLVAKQDGNDLLTEVGGELGGFADELVADLLHSTVALLNDNKNILTHCSAPSHQMM